MTNPSVPRSNRRILVVDDNPAIHADFKKILSPAADNSHLHALEAEIFGDSARVAGDEGFQVDSAFQGQEGLAKVQQSLAAGQPYSVIFIDVRMPPGWDGVEAAVHIYKADPDAQLVICTAYSDYSWNEIIARLGMTDALLILNKPFDNAEVIQLANALAEKWRVKQEIRLKIEPRE